jgi:peptidyl-dipeptidase A
MADRAARKVVDAWTERIAPVHAARARAWWDASLSATEENSKRYAAALRAVEEAAHDPEGYGRIERSLREGATDPRTARSLEVLRRDLMPYQAPPEIRLAMVDLEARVQRRYATVRGHVGGRAVPDHEIGAILKTSDDSERRREAWEASKEVGAAVADDVRALARLRNEAARALGHRDHYALELPRQEIAPAWLDGFFARIEEGTTPAFAAYKEALDARLAARFRVKPADLRPWHLEDPFFQHAPEAGRRSLDGLFAQRIASDRDFTGLVRRTYEGIGLDVGPAIERSDLAPRPGKSQHAFCTHVDREGDVRVLSNVAPTERAAATMLHEFGHAIYDLRIDRGLPWPLRRPPHASSTEAIAMLFGRLAGDPEWLEPVLSLPPAAARETAAAAAAASREGLLVFARWVLVITTFERAMYADPDGDLDALWWDLVRRHQRVSPPPGRRAPDWAAKLHVALAPVYYHSYLMGECTASQIRRHVRERVPGGRLVDNPAAGAWLRDEFFAPGSSLSWNDHLARATGSPLDPSILLAEACGAA